jgi:hypothetical protein
VKLLDDVAPAGGNLEGESDLLTLTKPLGDLILRSAGRISPRWLSGVHLYVVEGDLLPMHVESAYTMSMWRGLLKLRYLHNAGV